MRLFGEHVLLSYKEWCTLRPLKNKGFYKKCVLTGWQEIGVLLQDDLGPGCVLMGWQDGRCTFTGDLTRDMLDRPQAIGVERCAFTGKLARKGGLIFLDVTHLCW